MIKAFSQLQVGDKILWVNSYQEQWIFIVKVRKSETEIVVSNDWIDFRRTITAHPFKNVSVFAVDEDTRKSTSIKNTQDGASRKYACALLERLKR